MSQYPSEKDLDDLDKDLIKIMRLTNCIEKTCN